MLDDLLQGEVILTDDEGQEETFKVIQVLEMNEKHYVLLQSAINSDEDYLILQVVGDIESDAATLVGIEEDEEWEAVAEAFDTLLYGLDDQID